MEIVTEQATAKLQLFSKPIDEMSDEEIENELNLLIRPYRGKQASKTKTARDPNAPKQPRKTKTSELDFDNLAE